MKLTTSMTITIHLNEEEGLILKDLCDNISGDPRTNARKLTNNISIALSKIFPEELEVNDYFSGNLEAIK